MWHRKTQVEALMLSRASLQASVWVFNHTAPLSPLLSKDLLSFFFFNRMSLLLSRHQPVFSFFLSLQWKLQTSGPLPLKASVCDHEVEQAGHCVTPACR